MSDVAGHWHVAGYTLQIDADAVRVDGREVRLAPTSRAVLDALAAEPGHVLSRRELAARLPRARSEHAVEMAVARLRDALGAPLVQTVVKRGYRLSLDGCGCRSGAGAG